MNYLFKEGLIVKPFHNLTDTRQKSSLVKVGCVMSSLASGGMTEKSQIEQYTW